jgi:hypothetical protein
MQSGRQDHRLPYPRLGSPGEEVVEEPCTNAPQFVSNEWRPIDSAFSTIAMLIDPAAHDRDDVGR